MFVTGQWSLDCAVLISTLFIVIYIYLTRNNNYWKNKGIPFIKPIPIIGNILNILLMKSSIGDVCKEVYFQNKSPFTGIYVLDQPFLVIRDLDLVKHILIKDFDYFMNRTMATNHIDDPMGSNILFLIRIPDWREIRKKITPAFSSSKLKLLHKLILDIGEDWTKYINKQVGIDKVIDCREACAKYTTESIISTSFGVRDNCFENENAPFRTIARRLYNWQMFWHALQTTLYFIAPFLVKVLHLRFLDKFSADFLRDAFWKIIHNREESKVVRNDLIDILVEMRKNQKLDGEQLLAQATQFFIAGYETSSSTMSFALYELAKRPDVQTKLRQEIIGVTKRHGAINYEAIQDMPYLDMVVNETLRMYPVVPFLDRRCTKDYKIPGTEIVINKGTGIYIPLMGIHYDPEYYPNPEEFDPLRFNKENRDRRPAYTHLPFGSGPRNCIGNRYALLNSKTGLISLLTQFEVRLSKQTQEIMKLNARGFLLQPDTGKINLEFIKI